MFNLKDIIFTLIIGGIIMCCAWWSAKTAKVKVFPSQTDMQIILVEAGYDIQVDGVIGKASREAWDDYTMRLIDDQHANN